MASVLYVFYGKAMRGMTAYSLSRVLPQPGEWVHTVKRNVYWVVANRRAGSVVKFFLFVRSDIIGNDKENSVFGIRTRCFYR
ncbi:hypothetical protein [Phocaeicola sp.]|uniref:hypothetical protein n=1 Tax=Phocaeicola sp. TaxID=2773926 RepID=UPI00262FE5BC|nr:hypothetical protein [Phocaeicola sp.]